MSLEIEVSNPMFWKTSALSFCLQTAVTSNVLIDNENHESAVLLLSHVLTDIFYIEVTRKSISIPFERQM